MANQFGEIVEKLCKGEGTVNVAAAVVEIGMGEEKIGGGKMGGEQEAYPLFLVQFSIGKWASQSVSSRKGRSRVGAQVQTSLGRLEAVVEEKVSSERSGPKRAWSGHTISALLASG